ncbi:MAG: mycothiol S-conjugate amidase [Actinomycetota bacterium]|jgi:mycothiol S-conjugate amidase|nr:mycothiol S-conjugate amidase [Actinomycetota bacterium]MEA2842920.1 mycothiol S-conjugate amidase [Actinomycetota bacterium]
MDQLRLLTVHAHPDDESSKGAGTVHRYAREGARCVLVCCTGGEEGDILNPAMERPEVRDRLHEVRMDELHRAAAIIGYDEVVLLGYRDSGMPGTEANANPDAFAAVELRDSIGRLVEVIRRERPHVVVTYADDQEGYPHPDHLRVHDISVVAFDAAGDVDAYPEAGPPWQPSKLYYSAWTKARLMAMHAKFLELGIESPFSEEWFDRPGLDHRITTRIEIAPEDDVRRDALLAHATQIDPASPFWFGLPADADREYPWDDYILARSLVDAPVPEDDLFAGLRQPARR